MSKSDNDKVNNDVVNYALDVALILMVVLQLRGRTLSIRQLLLPVAIVAYFAVNYLKTFPTAGNDVVMISAGAALGAILGVACGLTTRVVARDDGVPVAKATWVPQGSGCSECVVVSSSRSGWNTEAVLQRSARSVLQITSQVAPLGLTALF